MLLSPLCKSPSRFYLYSSTARQLVLAGLVTHVMHSQALQQWGLTEKAEAAEQDEINQDRNSEYE